MKTNHDYRTEAQALVGTLIGEAIRITGDGQFYVHVDYSGYVDTVYIHAQRATCSGCWDEVKHLKLFREHCRLSTYHPDDQEQARRHWETTLATLNHWLSQLRQLRFVTDPRLNDRAA